MVTRQDAGRLTLRWSWRDLRSRWGLVAVIAFIIAIGTGTYAGLGGTASWRRTSNDASFALLHFHDLRVELSTGTTAPEGSLAARALGIAHASTLEQVQERLVVPTQIDAAAADDAVLARARLVGMSLGTDAVDALDLEGGVLPAVDRDEVVVEAKFADHQRLEPPFRATLAGNQPITVTGVGVTPEYFLVTGSGDNGVLAQSSFAVMFAPLSTVQRITGLSGEVNDLVVTVAATGDLAEVQDELTETFGPSSGVSATVLTRTDDFGYRVLYDDISGDQKVYRALSFLVLGAAAIAAYNLVTRIVESQRREIGIQMALGIPPRQLARRPLLMAGEIAVIGAALGVGVGVLLARAMRSLYVELLPLPIWRTSLDTVAYLQAAVIGFSLPFLASIAPIRRAVRIEPVDAIRSTPGTARTSVAPTRRPSRFRAKNSLSRLPVRNVARTPRRSLLTAVGVGAAIAALVGVLGLLDSFQATIRGGERELLGGVPDRVTVELEGLQAVRGATATEVCSSDLISSCDPRLDLPGTLVGDHTEIDVVLGFRELDTAAWAPTIRNRHDPAGHPGIALAPKAAADLRVGPGDRIIVRLPTLTASGASTVEATMTVIGLQPNPMRSFAYLDLGDAAGFGFEGIVNGFDVVPAAGIEVDAVERAMFTVVGVAAVVPISATTDLFDAALDQYVGFLVIVAGVVLVLGVLIAFNTTSVAVDERRREHATMFAMGLPVRRVVVLLVEESVLLGAASTVVGVVLGYAMVWWLVRSVIASTVPELGIVISVSITTLGLAAAIGIVAVALTPLLVARRLRRMVITDTLRVME